MRPVLPRPCRDRGSVIGVRLADYAVAGLRDRGIVGSRG